MAPSLEYRRPYARRYSCGLNSCRYNRSSGRPRLPRSRRTSSTVAASRITRTSWPSDIRSPGPLRPAVDGFPVLPGGALLPVGWAARRGPSEPGPFPGSLPPNPACPLSRHRALQRLRRVRDRVCVDPVMARCADDERLAPHPGHDRGPCGLVRSWFPELSECGDLVESHRGAGLTQLAYPLAEPSE